MQTSTLIYKEEAYKIVGAAMTVHKELGCGFLEAVYQEALAMELNDLNIPAKREEVLGIAYKGRPLLKHYIADLICYDKIIIELKSKMGDLKDLDLTDASTDQKDALDALLGLGFTKKQALQALGSIDTSLSLERKISQAIKFLGKQ